MQVVNRINIKTIMTWGACVLVFVVLIVLGFWQLERADEKKALIELLEFRQQQAPIMLDGSQGLGKLRYRRVQVSGVYDSSHQFLLDNQVVDGKIGVFVLTPLKIQGSRHSVLVNRGWVPMTDRRIVTSDLNIQPVGVEVEGLVNHFPGVGFKLNGAEIPADGWPGLIQLVDSEVLSGVLGYPLLPFQILLDPDFQSGFIRDWKISYPVSPEKHIAYAVQWFALAATFIVVLGLRRVRSDE